MSPPAWEIYQEQMIRLRQGFPLWEAAPSYNYDHVRIGDIGYVQRGHFTLLFNAIDPGNFKVPDDFVPLVLSEPNAIFKPDPRPAGPLCTRSMWEINQSFNANAGPLPASATTTVKLSAESGAGLYTPSETHRSDTELADAFKAYWIKHHNSIYEFAQQRGHDLKHKLHKMVLVTGCDLTAPGVPAMFAFQSSGSRELSFGLNLTAPNAPVGVGAELGAKWVTDPLVHTNGPRWMGGSNPYPTSVAKTLEEGQEAKENKKQYCVFIRGWRIQNRLFRTAKRLRGGASPPPPSGSGAYPMRRPTRRVEGDKEERLPLEDEELSFSRPDKSGEGTSTSYAGYDEDEDDDDWTDDEDFEPEVDNLSGVDPSGDPLDVIFDFIIDNAPFTRYGMIHDEHLVKLMVRGDPNEEQNLNFKQLLEVVSPLIDVDRDDVGTLLFRDDMERAIAARKAAASSADA